VIDPGVGLGQLVAERPSRAGVFERLRLDYCCSGDQTLAQACERRGLDADTVCRTLEALEDAHLDRWRPERHDWRRAPIAELCEHIIATHHDKLRTELPRIGELLDTVVRVHGAQHHELHDLRRLFLTMRRELESHIATEERVVFPACRAAEADGIAVDEHVLIAHEREHDETGDALTALRELAHDYDPAAALCGTHRRLLEAFHRFELDLHQHIHEENNVLFPRARALG
jgi:regulator of cell morphogenesis and NO signaling